MNRIQLLHPLGKNAPTMDSEKYHLLKTAFLESLQRLPEASFETLLVNVEKKLKDTHSKTTGPLHWNLTWVIKDLEARKEIRPVVSAQHKYFICQPRKSGITQP